MKQEIADKWIAALESGEFDQTAGVLMNDKGYCCLGVLCKIAVDDGVIDPPTPRNDAEGITLHYIFDGSSQFLPDKVVEWAGLNSDNGEIPEMISLINANDVEGLPFTAIANLIRDNVEIL